MATINTFGIAIGRSPGTTIISANCEGKAAQYELTVYPATAALTADSASARLDIGGTLQLHAVARDASGLPITPLVARWYSDAPTVATITPDGPVSAASPGVARMQAILDEPTVEVVVTVASSPGLVVLGPTTAWFPRASSRPFAWPCTTRPARSPPTLH